MKAATTILTPSRNSDARFDYSTASRPFVILGKARSPTGAEMMDTRRDVAGVIHLIGPGGAGKSTAAPHIAALLGFAALDLDRLFESECGCIDAYIETYGYAAYAAANVDAYLADRWRTSAVFALS